MIQWPRFCGPNSAPIDCEWLRFLSNSEVYKFVSWLFVFQGIQRRQPPSITIYHCISLENNHSVPQVFLWKKTHPSVPMTCPRNNSDLARSLVAWEEAWELGNDFLVPWAASVGFGFFFFVFFLGWGYPMFGYVIKEHVCFLRVPVEMSEMVVKNCIAYGKKRASCWKLGDRCPWPEEPKITVGQCEGLRRFATGCHLLSH